MRHSFLESTAGTGLLFALVVSVMVAAVVVLSRWGRP